MRDVVVVVVEEKWSEKRQRVSSCRSQTRDNGEWGHWEGEGKGHSRRGQIVSSHGGKISAEIPLNAYLLYFKGAPKDILKLKGYRS